MQVVLAFFQLILILVAIFSIYDGNKKISRELSANSYIAYTQKYDSLELRKSKEWKDRLMPMAPVSKAQNDKLEEQIDSYLHLCCQQYHLHKYRMIDKTVWNLWRSEIEQNLNTNLIRHYWQERGLYKNFQVYKDFQGYVFDVQGTAVPVG